MKKISENMSLKKKPKYNQNTSDIMGQERRFVYLSPSHLLPLGIDDLATGNHALLATFYSYQSSSTGSWQG